MPVRCVAAALLVLLLTAVARAQPAVSAISPGAVAPGKTTELVLAGQKLDHPLAVWTSFPGQVELQPVEPNQRKIKVTLADNVPLGIGGIVVANFGGVSPPIFVMIDDLPSLPEAGNNNAAATPQDLTPPIAIDGTSNGQQFDYYRLTLAQGQRISLEVVAARMGADFDSVLRVLDANGRELALADDDEALGADARLLFTAPAAGQYLLELRDNRYKPGGRYRLRVGDFPLVDTAYPAGGTSGAHLAALLATRDGAAFPATVQLPTSSFDTSVFASAKRPEGGTQGFARMQVSPLPQVLEIEASTHSPPGQPLAAPVALNGRLHEPKQRDRYAFAARKGERLNFQATSRRFGSPAVIAMRVINAADGQVAATTPTEAEEELLAFTAPDDGTYRLEVEDLLGRGGPTYMYRIDVTQGPLFNLVAKNDPNTRFQHLLASGGAFLVDVQVQRNGYDGPVALSVASSRAGFRTYPAVIGEKVNELRVYVFPPPDFHAGELLDLRLIGKANVGPREHTAVARNLVQQRAARPLLPHPPGWLDSAFFVGYADQAAFYTLAPAMAEVPVAIGAQGMVPFAFERTDANFKDVPLTLHISGLPAGVTSEVKRNGNGPKESYETTFKAAANAPEGKHAVHWLGYVEFQGRGRVVEGDITLVINKP